MSSEIACPLPDDYPPHPAPPPNTTLSLRYADRRREICLRCLRPRTSCQLLSTRRHAQAQTSASPAIQTSPEVDPTTYMAQSIRCIALLCIILSLLGRANWLLLDRPLIHINRKGRPISQCPHYRGFHKACAQHAKYDCAKKVHGKQLGLDLLRRGLFLLFL